MASTLIFVINVRLTKGSATIYIRADGSIDPPSASIASADNVTYTFTDNIYDEIVVERSNIIVDGAGYKLDGWIPPYYVRVIGIYLWNINNVTIKNMNITRFNYGVWLGSSTNNVITGNNITANGICGIKSMFVGFANNVISGNNIINNGEGIRFE